MNIRRVVLLVLACCFQVKAADRPNVVWILSEDNSTHFLEMFDESGAPTPNIERLAAHGLAFDHAFSGARFCAGARTTLMTAIYAPRIGTQFHRKLKPVTLPEGWQLFPAYLRKAGYYTSNNSKTDYNTADNKGVWDDSSNKASWRNRPTADTPFFHMQTFMQSHESSLHFPREDMATDKTETDPASVRLAGYHPDTPTFRYTYARYHDRIEMIDQKVGEVVKQLEHDGLLEDTFIFYFGDNGGVLPGSKGYLRETGLHVPLVVRIPEKWRHLVDAEPGSRVSGFVEFVDFGPTVLKLAGLDVPSQMDGKPFLGRGVSLKEVNRRDEAFGYADRMDERYEMVRSLRKGRWKYVRYFQGNYPDALQNNYRYKMPAYQEWRLLFEQGALTDAQRQFFEPKPAEALYDIEADPYEVRNLAAEPESNSTLERMRTALRSRLRAMPDLSFFPESVLVEEAVDQPMEFAQQHRSELLKLEKIAALGTLPFDKAREPLAAAFKSDDRWVRYWALMDCATFGQRARLLRDEAEPLLTDPELLVRVRAAEFLGGIGAIDPAPTLKEVLRTTDSAVVSLIALNVVVHLRDGMHHWAFDIKSSDVPAQNDEVKRRLEYLAAPLN